MINVKHLYDPETFTLTYVVFDASTKGAVVIDPVLDFDPANGRVTDRSIQSLNALIRSEGLNVHYFLETHAHADHLSSAHFLIERFYPKAKIGIGSRITEVQTVFKNVFNLPDSFQTNGRQFHRLFASDETVTVGSLQFKVLYTPGHTPACVSYLFGDAVFVGDALSMPDYGTGRCDFPKGDPKSLYNSIKKVLYALPDATRVYTGHDYQPGGRPLKYETTIAESKRSNIQLNDLTTEAEYCDFRKKRDATLSAPRLLLPSIQVNISAGELPAPESNGKRYLKLPLDVRIS